MLTVLPYTCDFPNNAEHLGSDNDRYQGVGGCSSVGHCEQEGAWYQENNRVRSPRLLQPLPSLPSFLVEDLTLPLL